MIIWQNPSPFLIAGRVRAQLLQATPLAPTLISALRMDPRVKSVEAGRHQ